MTKVNRKTGYYARKKNTIRYIINKAADNGSLPSAVRVNPFGCKISTFRDVQFE